MASIKINSRLKHFKLVARVTQVSGAGICGEADFDRMPVFGGLEAMAQLAALHVRYCQKFERHAFLLKINRGQLPVQKALTGCYRLSAHLRSKSSDTFAYGVKAVCPAGVMFNAELLIGTKPYGSEFKEEILKAHYKALFRELQMDK
jgi:hypothetical protein